MNTEKKAVKNTVVVAYHANCIDGFTSAWVAHNGLTREGYEVKLQPMEYTDRSTEELLDRLSKLEFASVSVDTLYIVDFSLKLFILARLETLFPKVTVIILDHHKTAFEEYAPDIKIEKDSSLQCRIHGTKIILDNNECGASLCWRFFNKTTPPPVLIQYVKDYDLYRFKFKESTKYINKYLRLQDQDIQTWDLVHSEMQCPSILVGMLKAGEILQRDHELEVKNYTNKAATVKLDGIKGLSVQCSPEYASDVGHELAVKSGTFGATFIIDSVNNEINWSLRSNGDFDVSAIAKSYGGGGHRNAAGFTASRVPDVVKLIVDGAETEEEKSQEAEEDH